MSRLADYAQCAKVQVQVLEDMVDAGSENLRGTLVITKRLVDVLEDLKFYRRKGKFKEEEARGSQGSPAYPRGDRFNQRLGLRPSAVSADFKYVLYETSSEKQYPDGVRDKGRVGKSIDDFMKMPQSKKTKMNKPEAASLRFYSSPSFPAVTIPLRDPDRETQHPLAALTYCIFTAIRKQLALGAEDQAAAVEERIFWRGFSDMQISEDFKKHGGTEFAPMSTSTDPAVAVGYAVRKSQTNGALLMRIVTKNNLQRGILVFSCSPYPPDLSILLCTLPVS